MYYKVLDKNLCSAVTHPNMKEYKVGQFVHANAGEYLFVFDTLEHAEDFAGNNGELLVYSCDIEGRVDIGTVTEFLNKCGLEQRYLPIGTRLVNGVKLVKQVEEKRKLQILYFVPTNGYGNITEVQEYTDNTFDCPKYRRESENIVYGGDNKYTLNKDDNGFFLTYSAAVAQAIKILVSNHFNVKGIEYNG